VGEERARGDAGDPPLLPALRRGRDPQIVIPGSVVGTEVYEGGGGYAAAKHGVHALAQILRLELLGDRIHITGVAPGMVETDFSLVRFRENAARAKDVYRGEEPLQAEDIADLIRYCVTWPPHVDLDYVGVKPTAQANARVVDRRLDSPSLP